ncbi:hypothetical protein BCR44DRAFT_1541634 [Catenaria anguillulae PL171]|uniref:Uncharacterized protein n=1 Tax=Catenaria anguillulae PL171 TaxID=765915 RepID=A0A1Y2HV01_9FUNG|nr:hypothetical protein BCR44DRAFT_1541634 [Catenaria anguillulae PL171]
MQNLYLGIARYALELFTDDIPLTANIHSTRRRRKGDAQPMPVLDSASLQSIHDVYEEIERPSGLGRLPVTLSKGFKNFLASKIRGFVHYVSVFLFAVTLSFPLEWLKAWIQFRDACAVLTTWRVDRTSCSNAVDLLHKFFTFLREHYGDSAITPSMHFALHYDESIDNTGPAPATWLFRFEQANGEFVSLNMSHIALLFILAIPCLFLLRILTSAAAHCLLSAVYPFLCTDGHHITVGLFTSSIYRVRLLKAAWPTHLRVLAVNIPST